MEEISQGLEALSLDPALLSPLFAFFSLIEEHNPTLKLVKAEGSQLVVKHILDSLAPYALLRSTLDQRATSHAKSKGAQAAAFGNAKPEHALHGTQTRSKRAPLEIADLGSGAGFPGIPLALAFADAKVSLVERMTRRADFLRTAISAIPVKNAKVIENQAEHLKSTFDLVTFRAFHPMEPKLCKKILRLCKKDGIVAAYKGKLDTTRAEMESIQGLCSKMEIVPLNVPFLDAERCILFLWA